MDLPVETYPYIFVSISSIIDNKYEIYKNLTPGFQWGSFGFTSAWKDLEEKVVKHLCQAGSCLMETTRTPLMVPMCQVSLAEDISPHQQLGENLKLLESEEPVDSW